MQTAAAYNSTRLDYAYVLGEQIEDAIADIRAANDPTTADDREERLNGLRLALAFTAATSPLGHLVHAREAQRLLSELLVRFEDKIRGIHRLDHELIKPILFIMQRIYDSADAAAQAG